MPEGEGGGQVRVVAAAVSEVTAVDKLLVLRTSTTSKLKSQAQQM
jgi:hypothetical protein